MLPKRDENERKRQRQADARRKRKGTRCEEFDSVRVEGAGREIGGSIRDEGGGGAREICSMRERTKLPMAINFATGRGEGRWKIGRGPPPAVKLARILGKKKKKRREESAIIPDSIIRGPRRALCRIVKRLCPDDLHPVLAPLSPPWDATRPIDYRLGFLFFARLERYCAESEDARRNWPRDGFRNSSVIRARWYRIWRCFEGK